MGDAVIAHWWICVSFMALFAKFDAMSGLKKELGDFCYSVLSFKDPFLVLDS